MLRKFFFITLLYIVFIFAFLKVAWGQEIEAGESAMLENNFHTEEASPSPQFDLRPIKLRKFLVNKGSPLADYTSFLIQKADEYKIDWKFFPAIAGVESGFCAAYIKSTNNCVGWGGGYISFPTINKQIEVVLASLKENYIDQGLTNIDLIGVKYAADPTWSFKVHRNMNEIETTEIL